MPIFGLFEVLQEIHEQQKDKLRLPFMQSPFVFAGIDKIAKTISSIPLKFLRNEAFRVSSFRSEFKEIYYNTQEPPHVKSEKVQKALEGLIKRAPRECLKYEIKAQNGVEEVINHPLIDVFDRPNPIMTRCQLWYHTVAWLLNDGQMFWVFNRNRAKEIVEIWPKPRWGFEPVLEAKRLKKWKFHANNSDNDRNLDSQFHGEEFDLDEIVRFYKMHPQQALDGMSPLVPAKSFVSQMFFASIFNESFFQNGAEPGWLLLADESIPLEKKEEILASMMRRHGGGPRNASKPAILDEGLKPHEVPSHKDMQFIKQMEWSRDVILSVLGVPKAIIGGLEQDVNRATFEAAKKAFFEITIIPELVYFSDLMYSEIFRPVDPTLFAVFDLAQVEGLRANLQELANAARDLSSAGFSRNELNCRLDMGFEDAEWGNEAFGNGALVPYSQLLNAKPSSVVAEEQAERLEQQQQQEPATGSPNPPEPPEGDNPDGDQRMFIRQFQSFAIRRNLKALNWRQYAEKTLDPNEARLKRDLLRFQKELADEQFEKLRKNDKAFNRRDIEAILFELGEATQRLEPTARAAAQRSAESGFESLRSDLGGVFVFGLTNPAVFAAVETSVQRVQGILKQTRDALRSQLAEGIRRKETLDQVTARFTAVFSFERTRAQTIARTETAQVVSATRHAAFETEGVERKLWLTAGDERVRSNHRVFGQLGAQLLDFNFMNSVGQSGILLHPSDPNGPAAEVINCRCVAVAAE